MDITEVPELVENVGYPLMIDSYNAVPVVYPQICEVLPVTDDLLYGERGNVVTALGEPDVVPYGQEIPEHTFDSAFTWRLKVFKLAHRLDLPKELIRASDAAGRIANLVAAQSTPQGRIFAETCDRFIANMVQKGTLTAGDLRYFDGSFPNETDSTPKYIYDGLPFFDTAHTLALSSTTPLNHIVSSSLTLANLQAAHTAMAVTNALDERGQPIVVMPDTLLIPSGAMEFTASVLLETMLKPGSANNDVNPMQGRYKLLPWRFLSDAESASSWWLFQTQRDRSIRVRDSGSPQIETVYDPKTQSMSVIWYKYFGACVQNWRGAFCCNKAAS